MFAQNPFNRYSQQGRPGEFVRTSNPSKLKVPKSSFDPSTFAAIGNGPGVPNQLPYNKMTPSVSISPGGMRMLSFGSGYSESWNDIEKGDSKSKAYAIQAKKNNAKVIADFNKNEELKKLMAEVNAGMYNSISHMKIEKDNDLPNESIDDLTIMMLS